MPFAVKALAVAALVVVAGQLLAMTTVSECAGASPAVHADDVRRVECRYSFGLGLFEADYVGTVVRGAKDGAGVYTDSHQQYDGEWRAGQRHGRGVARLNDGTRLEGHFAENVPHGALTADLPAVEQPWWDPVDLQHRGRGSYKGNWTRGLMDGAGEVQLDDVAYVGTFNASWMTGTGKLKARDRLPVAIMGTFDGNENYGGMATVDKAFLSFNCSVSIFHVACAVTDDGERACDDAECTTLGGWLRELLRFQMRLSMLVSSQIAPPVYPWAQFDLVSTVVDADADDGATGAQ